MPTDQSFLDEIERKLAVHAPSLAAEYLAAVPVVMPTLSEHDFRTWAEEGVELAGHSLRSWEAAVDYFRVSGEVMRLLPSGAFRRWAHAGRGLAEYSSVVAAAFFKASPKSVPYLDESPIVGVGGAGPAAVQGALEVDLAGDGVLQREPGHAAGR